MDSLSDSTPPGIIEDVEVSEKNHVTENPLEHKEENDHISVSGDGNFTDGSRLHK